MAGSGAGKGRAPDLMRAIISLLLSSLFTPCIKPAMAATIGAEKLVPMLALAAIAASADKA